jgi:hypothetical protein
MLDVGSVGVKCKELLFFLKKKKTHSLDLLETTERDCRVSVLRL